MLRIVAVVTAKELRETARDPHVVVFVLFPVLFYPLLLWGVVQLVMVQEGWSDAASWRIDAEGPPEVVEALLEGNVAAEGGEVALRDGTVDLVVRTEVDGDAWTVTLAHSGVRTGSNAALSQAKERLTSVRKERVDAVAERLGVEHEPKYEVVTKLSSSTRELVDDVAAMLLGLIVPTSLLIAALYPAVDVAVSEREKGTIETTLSSSAPFLAVLAGRAGACVVLALVGALGNAVGMVLTAEQLGVTIAGDASLLWIPRPDALLALPVLVAAAVLSVAVYLFCLVPARSFKEGEYLGSFALVVMAGAMLACVPVIVAGEPPGLLAWLPFANLPVAVHGALKGQLGVLDAAVGTVVNLVPAGLLLALTARITGSEAFAFAGEIPAWLAWVRRGTPP